MNKAKRFQSGLHLAFARHATPRTSAAVLLVAAALVAASCETVPLFAPNNSTVSISAPTRTLAMGASTEITAIVAEPGGTPVQNGTSVRFTTSLGRLEPVDAQTRNGIATATFFAGDTSGVAEIRASSGSAGAGSTGSGTTTPGTTPAASTSSNVVTIQVGAAAVTAVVATATPSTVSSSGGVVTVTASAVDTNGNRLQNIPVTFSTTAGTLSASSAVTDANGNATVQLNTNRAATITVRAGAQTATAAVAVTTPASVALTVSPANPIVLQPVTLTVAPTIAAGGIPPRVVVTWGDGTSDDLGVVAASRGVTHIYREPGSFTITATATAEGETFTTSTAVLVNLTPPVSLSVNPSTGNTTTLFTFTITPTQGAPVRNIEIDFGDGTTTSLGAISNQTVTTHRYTSAGTYTVKVTQTLVDTTTSTAFAVVTVTSN